MKVVFLIFVCIAITFSESGGISVNEIEEMPEIRNDMTSSSTNNRSIENKNSSQEVRTPSSGGYYTRQEAQSRLAHFLSVKRSGIRRSLIGLSLTTVGIILMSSADWETTSTSTSVQKSTHDPQGVVGMVMLFPGIPISILGLVQLGIGSTKANEYQNLFKDTQVNLTIQKESIGLAFNHRF